MKKMTSKRKRFILTVLLTVLLSVVLSPFYTNNHIWGSIHASRFKNKTARIDISNVGSADKRIEVLPPPPHALKHMRPIGVGMITANAAF